MASSRPTWTDSPITIFGFSWYEATGSRSDPITCRRTDLVNVGCYRGTVATWPREIIAVWQSLDESMLVVRYVAMCLLRVLISELLSELGVKALVLMWSEATYGDAGEGLPNRRAPAYVEYS